ncbi:MAG: beta-galactosidase [Lentisphaeria bacterium]
MQIGCAYYPEAWDVKRVEYDAQLMQEAGVTLVRIGEFCWSHLEPAEGHFTFDWLHQAIEILAQRGVQTILCTPTSTAPAWLVKKFPEILIAKPDGTWAYFGVRDHTCVSSDIYLRYCRLIVEKLAGEFQSCPHVIAWQIDNELGHTVFGNCHCSVCQQKFRQFLQKKYATVSHLNTAWGTTFWSQEYSDWDEIELGDLDRKIDSTRVLDSLLFWDEAKRGYLDNQLQVLRRFFPTLPITANNVSGLSDRYRMFAKLDFSAMDFYPCPGTHGMTHTAYYSDLWRNLKPGVSPWILESATSPGAPGQNLLRFYLWHFLARGYDHIVYFHWRSHLGGYEKTHGTILGPTGKPRARYQLFKESIREVQDLLTPYEPLPQPSPEAGVIFDHENHWNYCQGFWQKWIEYEKLNLSMHGSLLRCGVNSDILSLQADFSRYKLLVLPALPHLSNETAAKLRRYVADGGTILATGLFGLFDGNAKLLPQAGPEHLQDVFGLRIEDFIPVQSAPQLNALESREKAAPGAIVFAGDCGGKAVCGQAGLWLADCELDGATALLTFSNTILKGQPLLSEHRYGKGRAYYLGTMQTDSTSLKDCVAYILQQAGIQTQTLPENVEMISRGRLLFVLNHNDQAVDFRIPVQGKNIMGNFYQEGCFRLPGREVSILDTGQ